MLHLLSRSHLQRCRSAWPLRTLPLPPCRDVVSKFLQNRATWETQGGRLLRQIGVRVETCGTGPFNGRCSSGPSARRRYPTRANNTRNLRREVGVADPFCLVFGRPAIMVPISSTCQSASDPAHACSCQVEAAGRKGTLVKKTEHIAMRHRHTRQAL